jgi:hypothetical protein
VKREHCNFLWAPREGGSGVLLLRPPPSSSASKADSKAASKAPLCNGRDKESGRMKQRAKRQRRRRRRRTREELACKMIRLCCSLEKSGEGDMWPFKHFCRHF